MKGLPLNFNGQNLVKRVRSSNAQDAQSQRLVFELTQKVRTNAVTQQNQVVFTMTAAGTPTKRAAPIDTVTSTPSPNRAPAPTPANNGANPFDGNKLTAVTSGPASDNTPTRARAAPPVIIR